MGFEKPKYAFDAKRETSKRTGTLADSLFGNHDTQKPTNETVYEPKIERLVSNSNVSDNTEQTENLFGSYVPSMTNNGPRQSKRNVKFVDDLFNTETSNERPKTTPTQPTNQTQPLSNPRTNDTSIINPLTKSLPTAMSTTKQSGYDWLGLSDDGANKNNDQAIDLNDSWLKPRDRSLPPANKETQQAINKANDWLGMKDSQNSSFERENNEYENKSKINNTQKVNTSVDGSVENNEAKNLNQGFSKSTSRGVLNSSFNDSIDNNANNSINNYQNQNLNANNILIAPINQNRHHESASESGSDIADAWLSNLMANKKPPKPETIPQSNRTKSVCFHFNY